ncbi:bifunctional DNA-formamidopyrimidine glycosylase/DNA-(apurinic or apyrimidinic site) lyase [Thiolapillus sp.]|uniref:bifunctional DNA-formamidopyrimidine glycosylase/DNA-(apurinic or apyrimidinic site) lyase n=1 Tax=Thiolapillus sp. TaxID=2017437 RepID=UPI0025CBFEB2
MPELPEVETTRRGIEPHIRGKTITGVIIRQPQLRWPVPPELPVLLHRRKLKHVSRRGKYLLLTFTNGTLLLHLGMSGSLRILRSETTAGRHDHFDLVFGRHCLRLHDPRRFGAVLWTDHPAEQHPLLAKLGPEPLSPECDGDYLYRRSRGRKVAVKQFIMNGQVVVGVGNIYANEALYEAGILPTRPCGSLSRKRCERLAQAIREILATAIAAGGTTLQDFVQADGRPGYFAQELQVYGREGEPCPACGRPIRQKTLGQRSSYYCSRCQR